MTVVDELMWDALQEGATKAAELGLYGPGQDLVADAFTGNLRGAGPATVALPFPVRKDNASQTVLVSFADKTEPMAFNHYATGAYMLPRFNTGLVIAASKMKRGYLFEIVDLDTKAQAVEAGAHPRDQQALDGKMEELAKGLQEKVITLRAPEDLYDIEGLTRSSRFVIARIWSRNEKGEKDQLGYVCSAERLHNIKTKKGFTYGGKDDPVLLAFAQGDWPAPGEITSPWATAPMVAGDCRGSHNLHILPMPINSQTSYWSGPILSAITLSCNIHTGRIGAISDQFALGTPWDEVRAPPPQLAIQFRHAHGIKQPATLHEDELEYQEGWKERRTRLERQFEVKPPLTFAQRQRARRRRRQAARRRPGGRPTRSIASRERRRSHCRDRSMRQAAIDAPLAGADHAARAVPRCSTSPRRLRSAPASRARERRAAPPTAVPVKLVAGLTCPRPGATVESTQTRDFPDTHGQAPPDHVRLPDERVRLRARRGSAPRASLGADRRRERRRPDPRQHLRDPREGRGQGLLQARRAARAQGAAPRPRHRRDGLHGAAPPGRHPAPGAAGRPRLRLARHRPGRASWSIASGASGARCSRPGEAPLVKITARPPSAGAPQGVRHRDGGLREALHLLRRAAARAAASAATRPRSIVEPRSAASPTRAAAR